MPKPAKKVIPESKNERRIPFNSRIGKPVASRKTVEVRTDTPTARSAPEGVRPLNDWRRRPSTASPYSPGPFGP
jgi:hypothetical protein